MIYWLDLIGTFVFAISGALAAWDKKMYHDIFGVSFTAFVTSIGGGTMRDLILGTRPVWVNDSRYVIAHHSRRFRDDPVPWAAFKIPPFHFPVRYAGDWFLYRHRPAEGAGLRGTPWAAVILG